MAPKTLLLLHEAITYSQAKEREANILHKLRFARKRNNFLLGFINHSHWIRDTVTHHLNLSPDDCEVEDRRSWIHGSFNLCIPVTTKELEEEETTIIE